MANDISSPITSAVTTRHDLSSTDDRRGEHELAVRLAKLDDVPVVKSWIQGEKEFQWLGGSVTFSEREKELASWVSSQYGAFILERRSGGPKPKLLAFACIEQPGHNAEQLEAGRLVVDPSERRKKFGRSLIDHLAISVANTKAKKVHYKLNARVLQDNGVAAAMFMHTLFRPQPHPNWAPELPRCNWYVCTLHPVPGQFGKVLAQFRKNRRYDQSTLGTICGVARTTIAAFESGRIRPSWDVLHKLISALDLKPNEHAHMLLSLTGQPPDVIVTETIDDELSGPHSHFMHLWVIVDVPAELDDAKVLEGSVEALLKGFQRYYFLPPREREQTGEELSRRISTRIHLKSEDDLARARALACLRFYEAPAALCSLRIVVKNPSQDFLRTESKAEDVTIAAKKERRISIDAASAKGLMVELHRVVSNLAERASTGEDKEWNGFRLLSIPRDKGS